MAEREWSRRAPDRYEVHEITGYTSMGDYRETTSVTILDRDYCYAVVERYPQATGQPVEQRRLQAEAKCRALNEEHRRFLHAGRWSTGEDAQARKGMVPS